MKRKAKPSKIPFRISKLAQREVQALMRHVGVGFSAPGSSVATSDSPALLQATVPPEPPKIFKTVDSRGVVHFSNIEPN